MTAGRRVRDLMSAEVVTLLREDHLSVAEHVMTLGRIRHMPVVDAEGVLVGVVSQRDLFRGALARLLGEDKDQQTRLLERVVVEDIMTPEPISIGPDELLADAARVMLRHKLGCLPVLAGGRLVGILTEGDFVASAARDAGEDRPSQDSDTG